MSKTPGARMCGARYRLPPYPTVSEAAFIEKERAKGRTEPHIAQMLDISIDRVRKIMTFGTEGWRPEPPANDNFTESKVRYITKEERAARNRAAREIKRWTPDIDIATGAKRES